MRTGALEGATPAERTAFVVEVQNAMRGMSAAMAQLGGLKKQMGAFRKAMDASSAGAGLEADYHVIRAEVLAIEEAMQGKSARQGMGATPATIGSRMFIVSMARANTWGPTATQREQLGYAVDAFNDVKARLDALVHDRILLSSGNWQRQALPGLKGHRSPEDR